MKRLFTYALIWAVVATVAMGTTAHAQSITLVKANIPFEFSVGAKSFPAGEYSVVEPLQNMIALRDAQGRNVALAFTQEVERGLSTGKRPLLRFVSVGDRNELAEIWALNNPSGQRVIGTRLGSTITGRATSYAQVSTHGNKP